MSTENDLSPEALALHELMSNVSEDHWCAGWYNGTEFALWRLIFHGGRWGSTHAADIPTLPAIATWALTNDCWIRYVDHEPEALTLDDWQSVFDAHEALRPYPPTTGAYAPRTSRDDYSGAREYALRLLHALWWGLPLPGQYLLACGCLEPLPGADDRALIDLPVGASVRTLANSTPGPTTEQP